MPTFPYGKTDKLLGLTIQQLVDEVLSVEARSLFGEFVRATRDETGRVMFVSKTSEFTTNIDELFAIISNEATPKITADRIMPAKQTASVRTQQRGVSLVVAIGREYDAAALMLIDTLGIPLFDYVAGPIAANALRIDGSTSVYVFDDTIASWEALNILYTKGLKKEQVTDMTE